MTKAEQEERDRHEAWEKAQEKEGIVHLPREMPPVAGAPGEPEKKKTAGGK